MNRFTWLIRREIWEHKAIWIAPAIVIGCLFVSLMIANAQIGDIHMGVSFSDVPRDGQIRLHQFVYSIVSFIVFWVMGVIGFFYSIDALYADRVDRSVLFWKSLPLSDAETVLSKFAVAAVIIPAVAMLGSVIAQLVVGGGVMAKLAMSGASVGLWWHPEAIAGGAAVAFVSCISAMLWYSPVIAYLMLASAWAPRAPFLWAVLPPVAAWLLERIMLPSTAIQDFLFSRLFGMYALMKMNRQSGDGANDIRGLEALADKLGNLDLVGGLQKFYSSPDLWLGVVAAGLLLAAAMWVRRYRDETS